MTIATNTVAEGRFHGYASLFGVADIGGDVVMPGAFRVCLARRGPGGIRLLFHHDPREPIGLWEALREDGHGLMVRGRLLPELARAREVIACMRAGAMDGLSIGFRAVVASRDAGSGLRRLHQIDLWEISIVTFPMLSGARVRAVKAVSDRRDVPSWTRRISKS